MSSKVTSLSEAVALVEAGDRVHVVCNHSRWTAAARELVRQWWEKEPGFELSMLSLSSLGTLFFRGELVDKVITGYSGDVFPNFTPNPWFGNAYLDRSVAVEHWSFLAFAQRLHAAADGLPATVTGSIAGSSMAHNDGFAEIPNPFATGAAGEPDTVGLLQAYAPDVALLHAPIADRAGNIALGPPSLEGIWGALAAKRGAIVTVEKIVDDIRPWSHLTRIPAHRVLAVVEVPMGAHPGGLYAPHLPVDSYAEDLQFWSDTRDATRSEDFDDWIRHWILEPTTQDEYLARLGADRIEHLRTRADPRSWRDDAEANPPDLDAPVGAWEQAATYGARHLAQRVVARDADAVLAGAGVANLAAWLAVDQARAVGSDVVLTAELGLWGYEPTPADPFVFNHRSFPSATAVGDAEQVLGTLVGGPGTTVIGALGAAQVDKHGNINSTEVPGKAFLVGSGGGNDVASTAAENVIICTLTTRRTVEQVPYITSPGRNAQAIVTDLGTFERGADGTFVLVALAPGATSVGDRVAAIRERIGWDLQVADDLTELDPVTAEEVAALRTWDPQGLFLRPD